MALPMIALRGIEKAFGGRSILSGVDLALEAGRFCALLGRNGVGKSTLMRIIVRQDLPTRGEGWVAGYSLSSDHALFNSDVGYASESIDFALPTSLHVFFSHYSKTFARWDSEKFWSILNNMGIAPRSDFRSLSRGQRMQVAFAAAFARRPRLLVLDEITSVLDANARAFFMKELTAFTKEGGTVLLATNIISEVQNYASQLVLLDAGKIKLNAELSEIAKHYIKLKKSEGQAHPVFEDPAVVEVALNSDGSTSFIAPVEVMEQQRPPADLEDNRRITAEEIFTYFTRSHPT